MRTRRPTVTEAIIKLNEGVSGSGNGLVDLHELPAPGSPEELTALRDRVLTLQPESEEIAVPEYLAAFEQDGGIIEERISGVS